MFSRYDLLLFSCSGMSDSLWFHGLQHTRLPCPLLSLGVCSNSCQLSQWCHPKFSSGLSAFPSIKVFSNESALHIRWLKCWSFSFSISPSNEYSGLISVKIDCLISLLSKGLSRVFFSTTVRKHQFFSASSWSNSHICMWLWINHRFDYTDLCW